MNARQLLAAGTATLALAVPAGASAAPAWGPAASTLRAATSRLIEAELRGDGATACAILNPPLDTTVAGRTCAQRWDARIAALLRHRGGARGLRRDLRAVADASVAIVGEHGSIALPVPLLNGHTRFYWTENCWMLTR